jgi:hypothetical protein
MNEANVEKIPTHLHQLEPSVFRKRFSAPTLSGPS